MNDLDTEIGEGNNGGALQPAHSVSTDFSRFAALNGSIYVDPEARHKELVLHLEELSVKIEQHRCNDIEQRIALRPVMARQLMALLVIQNITVFLLVIFRSWLSLDTTLLGIIVSASLTETAYMVKKIVEFAFKEIDYKKNEGK